VVFVSGTLGEESKVGEVRGLGRGLAGGGSSPTLSWTCLLWGDLQWM
jgi:hypothetical protein